MEGKKKYGKKVGLAGGRKNEVKREIMQKGRKEQLIGNREQKEGQVK